MKWCLVVLILVGVTRADNSLETGYSIFTCPDLNSQEEIDLNAVSLLYCPFLRLLFSFFFRRSPRSSADYVTVDFCGLPVGLTRPIVKIIGYHPQP